MTDIIKFGKFSLTVSDNSKLHPYLHHFVKLQTPIVVGPKHMAVGFGTVARRSNRTGAIISNSIQFLRVSKIKKDGTPSKAESWTEFKPSAKYLDRAGFDSFNELFILTSEYEHFYNLQVDIGKGLYDQYHDYLPDLYVNDISVKTYLRLKRDGQFRREEARLEARNKMLEARARFIGNDPIIGMTSVSTPSKVFSQEMIDNQLHKINRLQKNIIENHPLNIDFTDHRELLEENNKLNLMERGFFFE